jgi:hypothetical protein
MPFHLPRPKFFAHVVTADRYMQLVPMPMATNDATMTPKGQPWPPAEGGGPLL